MTEIMIDGKPYTEHGPVYCPDWCPLEDNFSHKKIGRAEL
jgi:hypothetical protein